MSLKTPRPRWLAAIVAATVGFTGLLGQGAQAYAATTTVALGSAGTYSVFGETGVTSSGATVLSGDLGIGPAATISGFPPGTIGGTTHDGDAAAAQADSDIEAAYADAAGRTPDVPISGDLGGQTFDAGVYNSSTALTLSGTLTLDGQGDPDAVFIFQVGGALNTGLGSTVDLINGAQAANVFWQVSGAAGTGESSAFSGTIIDAGPITIGDDTDFTGAALSYTTVTLATAAVTTPVLGGTLTADLAGPVSFPAVPESHSPVAATVQDTSVTVDDDLTGTADGWVVTIVASPLTDMKGDVTVGTIPAGNVSLAADTNDPVAVSGSLTGVSGGAAGPIGAPTTLMSATSGDGVGDYTEAFSLGLNLPGNTPAGLVYVGTLTVTATPAS